MKIKKLLQFGIVCFFFAAWGLPCRAQQVTIPNEAGGLAGQLAGGEMSLGNLKITGTLNGDDIAFLRKLINVDPEGNEMTGGGILTRLDLSEAGIVEGGNPYYKPDDAYNAKSTENNVIGEFMFAGSPQLQFIALPAGATVIKGNAFAGSYALTEVKMPAGITEIGYMAFDHCSALTSFTFPNVSSVADQVLSYCGALTSVTLPETVTSIGFQSFAYCRSLTEIHSNAVEPPVIGSWSQAFTGTDIANCMVFVPAGSAAKYRNAEGWKDFKRIVEEVTEVEPQVVALKEPGTLPAMLGDMQYLVHDLTVKGDINGTDVRFLRDMAGRNYKGEETPGRLTHLNLAEADIVAGGDYYYQQNNNLEFRTEDNVLSEYMFTDCKLQNIVLPLSTTEIRSAFSGCYSLGGALTIPEGVTTVGNYAFQGCAFTEVSLPSTLSGEKALGANAFSGCQSLQTVNIPDGVTAIASGTFQDCSSLTYIEFHQDITRIAGYAFKGCTALQEIRVKAKDPITKADYDSFGGVDKSACMLYVPAGCAELYKNYDLAGEFCDFSNIVEDEDIQTGFESATADGVSILSCDGGIVVNGIDMLPVSVYSPAGQLLHCHAAVAGEARIVLPAGSYIVRVGTYKAKVAVR